MELRPGTYDVGPAQGRLELHTTREGVAAKVGHDLVLGFGAWSATVRIPAPEENRTWVAEVEADIDLRSVRILGSSGGVAPLSPKDAAEIDTIARRLLDVERRPTARLVSIVSTSDGEDGVLTGTLTLRDRSADVALTVRRLGENAIEAHGSVRQSAFGIAPFRAFFGALRLADPVRVEVRISGAFGRPR